MAWLGKVTLGNFSDIAGAVNKFSESVKNIEKNFDSALGFDEKGGAHEEGQRSSAEKRTLLAPVLAFVSQKELSTADVHDPSTASSGGETAGPDDPVSKPTAESAAGEHDVNSLSVVDNQVSPVTNAALDECNTEIGNSEGHQQPSERVESPSVLQLDESAEQQLRGEGEMRINDGQEDVNAAREQEVAGSMENERPSCTGDFVVVRSANLMSSSSRPETADSNIGVQAGPCAEYESQGSSLSITVVPSLNIAGDTVSGSVADPVVKQQELSNGMASLQSDLPRLSDISDISRQNPVVIEIDTGDIEKLKVEVKMLEAALQGAAKQAQMKADEISRLLIENEELKAATEDLKKKSSDAGLDALREEYQQRLGAAERKIYALTKERDMLRREQNRKDSSILLKEKDEIIKQVMVEGEELSKKQAAQEAQMRKLRAQMRELEEEKQRLKSKLQVEEATVESIRKDKAATEKALQDVVERSQVELAAQKEFYTNALNEAKEAEARAEARADYEAKLELERRLREAGDRETALVQALEELRQALSQTGQQAAAREDMLRRDIEDLERRCQAAEWRHEELVARVPESTRPLLRQIEAIQESTSMRTEAWIGVERALNARLQEAEAKAAGSQERERAINERLTQNLSRMAVLEAQVSCLKAEQAQLARSLEKERQRASENRQEYLVALESVATQEGRAKQLEEDIKELRSRHKRELAEEKTLRELLEQELEHEKKARMEQEKQHGSGNWTVTEKVNASHANSQPEYGSSRSLRRFSSVSSGGSSEESYFLQASLDSTLDQMPGDRVSTSGRVPQPYVGKGVFPSATLEQLEALLSQKEGELALYMSRLASLESTRDSLAEELVKATTQCEKLRAEVASVPGLRAELESLRGRHTSALELMGERDEEVEELKADLADVKQMYREQIDMLVNQIEKLSISIGTR